MRLTLILLLFLTFNTYSQSDNWDKEYMATDDSYVTKGDNMYKQKMFFEAIQLFNKSIEINNKNYYSYMLRGSAKAQLNDDRGALIDLVTAEEVLNLDKEHKGRYTNDYKLHLSIIYLIRGISYMKLKDKNEGCLWLSKSGELGNRGAYSGIQKFCN